jgi:hypothetical protein
MRKVDWNVEDISRVPLYHFCGVVTGVTFVRTPHYFVVQVRTNIMRTVLL